MRESDGEVNFGVMEGDRILERVIRQAKIRGRTGRRTRQKQNDRETDREGEFVLEFPFSALLLFCCVKGFGISMLNV